MKKETWLLVADGAGARLLRLDTATRRLELVADRPHEAGRTKTSDLMTDRPGRSLDSSHVGVRHAMEPRTDPRRIERHRFAAELAAEVEAAANQERFSDLVLVAAPAMLGELRAALPERLAELVRQEIPKDLAGLSLPELQTQLVPQLG